MGAKVAASLGKLGVAAGAAGAALAGAAAAAGAMALVFRRVSRKLDEAVQRLAQYSPEIEIARAEADIARQQQEQAMANKLGPDLAEFVRAQSQLELYSLQLRTRMYELMTKIYKLGAPFIKLGTQLGELILTSITPVMKVIDRVEEVIDDVVDWLKQKLGLGDDDEAPKFLDDPFLRDWLGDLPKPPPPGPAGDNGGVR